MKKNAPAEISVSYADGSKKDVIEQVEHEFGGNKMGDETAPQAYVELAMGVTEPTKPYGGVRVDVKLGFHTELGELDEAHEFQKEWIDSKIGAILEEVKADLES